MRRCCAAIFCLAALTAFATAGWGETYSATTAGEHAIELTSGTAEYSNITVNKTGDASGSSDDYDFKGTNAAILASGGSKLTISGAEITSNATYGNAVFSYGGNSGSSNSGGNDSGGGNGSGTPPAKPSLAASGDGTTITISDSTITTSKNNSGGIMVTGGGILNATNLTVTTSGGSSAAIRSDKGGGTMTVTGGTFTTSGTGSPAIYSTADITVSDAALKSTTAQGVVVEGGNSVTLKNCTVNANHNKLNGQDTTYNGVMLYQSMSGDASDGSSSFSMTGGSLTNANGSVFHVTNVTTAITLSGVSITNNGSGAFLNAAADSWGTSSSNGGKVTLTASSQTIKGDMVVDSISTLNLTLKDSSTFTGAITSGSSSSSAVSTASDSRSVSVTIEAGSTWNMTGDSTITSLTNNGTLNKNGYTLTTGSSSGDGDENSSSNDNGTNDGTNNGGSGSGSSSHSGCDTLRGTGAWAALGLAAMFLSLLRKKGI